ncbi:ribosome maturation factor RimM [Thioalkalivibrio denitrificans]|uniref:Ribosome maturation factor RimM n=1 Tax=Thioalkalivibrio denitrificans TaxID=108003 RepID=A0A1V3NAZ1_9GAMM|nr:ribosome maturation factor RimM [Thioalkalivibrio denitrificans]OOG22269.1 ribosome maturation factor RimM [Thioalkalivibrio denitrificans]
MQERRIILGRISGVFGVQGWVKVFSDTEPREQITRFNPIQLGREGQWREARIEAGRSHGKGVVMKIEGCDDRDAAAALMNSEIAVWRDQLPPLPEGEHYWADLVGLKVLTRDGTPLGVVQDVMQTGANDVIQVQGERERLIPWVLGDVVREVDLEAGIVRVDWDPEF